MNILIIFSQLLLKKFFHTFSVSHTSAPMRSQDIQHNSGSETRQESCAIAKITARCADKSKQTTTPPSKITWLSVDSIQPDVMDIGAERTFSPQNFSMFPREYVDDRWATNSEDFGLIVRAISFQDFQPKWSWSTNVTDSLILVSFWMYCQVRPVYCYHKVSFRVKVC